MLAVAVAAGRYPDGLDAGVQAFGAGVGDRVGELGQQSRLVTLQCLGSVDDRHGIPQARLQEFQGGHLFRILGGRHQVAAAIDTFPRESPPWPTAAVTGKL